MSEAQTQDRQASNVITSENLQEFQFKRLGIEIPSFTESKVEDDTGDGNAEDVVQTALNDDPESDIEDTEIEAGHKKAENKKNSYIRLREQRNAAREETERLKQEIETLKKQPKVESIPEANAKPLPSQFTDAFEYAEKLSEWSAEEALRKQAKNQAEAKEREKTQSAQAEWNKKVSAILDEYPDYHEMTDDLMLPNPTIAALRDSEIGPRIGVYLAENLEELEKLQGLSAVGQVKFIDRLEVKLLPKKAEEVTKPSTKSKAPEPVKHVKPSSTMDGIYDANGDFTGTPAQWRELRKSGKIK